MVVTARLHVTRRCGVTKVCPGTRTAGCHHLVSTRTRSQSTVAIHHARRSRQQALTNQVPAAERRRHHRRPLRRALTPGLPARTNLDRRADTSLDGSTLHRYADLALPRCRRAAWFGADVRVLPRWFRRAFKSTRPQHSRRGRSDTVDVDRRCPWCWRCEDRLVRPRFSAERASYALRRVSS